MRNSECGVRNKVVFQRHCEERFSRRGNLEVIDLFKTKIVKLIPSGKSEIASLRSQ